MSGPRFLPLFLLFLGLFLTGPVAAQTSGVQASGVQTSDQAAAKSAPLTAAEAQELLGILDDPKKRDAFTHALSLMARGVEATMPASALPAATAPAAQATTTTAKPAAGSEIAEAALPPAVGNGLRSLATQGRTHLDNFLRLFKDLWFVQHWARTEFSSAAGRAEIFSGFNAALGVMVCGLLAEHFSAVALRRPLVRLTKWAEERDARRAQHDREEETAEQSTLSDENGESGVTRASDQRRQIEFLRLLRRAPFALGHFLIKALPVLALLLIAWLATLIFPWSYKTVAVVMTVACSYAAARGLYLLVETALAPRSPAIRLFPATDATAFLVVRWWNVLVAGPAIVFCLSQLGGLFDLEPRGTDAMIRAVVLVEHVIIAAFIWRVRRIVSRAFQPSNMEKAKAAKAFVAAIVRMWWVPAMFLDISLWVVWAARLRGGYIWILHATGVTVGILGLSRLAAILVYGWQDRLFRVNPELAKRFPDMQKRANRYYPLARAALTAFLVFLTLLAITEAWGLPTIGFFLNNAFGRALVQAAISTTVAVTVAIGIWELSNAQLNRQVQTYESVGQRAKATRLRTVMPIIRTVLLTFISVIVAVTTLSQIGINVAPLLTGAGILGAAIAFGSQSLVKDFITGFFMLVEDAIQVGDWVTTGGISGTVENLSIRTVKLRDIDGDLHIIPFSSVASIANTARGYNQIIIRQQLDLSEDQKRVVAIMARTVKEMREDKVFGPMILSDYQDQGADTGDGNGCTLLGSIRTAPMMKWRVRREFYRRVAPRFAEAGVNFFTPTSYVVTPPGGSFHLREDAPPPPAPDTSHA